VVAVTDRSAIAHLLRRTGFGPTVAEVDAATTAGYEATVERLLDFSGTDAADAVPLPAFTPYQPLGAKKLTVEQRRAAQRQRAAETAALVGWWLERMRTSTHPLREKLTWFWHGHFATSVQKVQRPELMAGQNQLFRRMAAGNFEELTQAVAKDPAMLLWLDAATNVKAHPNENFARELMELFTLGIGNYTEIDVKEAARAFTGWRVNPTTQAWTLASRQHDIGSKTLLGQTGTWSGEDAIRIVTNHPASAPFVASRLWSHLAYPVGPHDPVVAQLAPAFAKSHDVAALVRAILLHPGFLSDTAQTGLVKQPVEWCLGILRVLGLGDSARRLAPALRGLGQVPFDPPNVGGWPQNGYWLTTASSLTRLQVSSLLVGGNVPAVVSQAAVADRPGVASRFLSVDWTPATATALAAAAADAQTMLALAFVAPEYTLA
jgi:uncharacterized protein (DUF1800 family)